MSAPKDIAENLWSHYASNLNHGFIDKIIVDPMVANAIGNIGIAHIAKRFEFVIIALLAFASAYNYQGYD